MTIVGKKRVLILTRTC